MHPYKPHLHALETFLVLEVELTKPHVRAPDITEWCASILFIFLLMKENHTKPLLPALDVNSV